MARVVEIFYPEILKDRPERPTWPLTDGVVVATPTAARGGPHSIENEILNLIVCRLSPFGDLAHVGRPPRARCAAVAR